MVIIMYDELTKVDIEKLKEELNYRITKVRPEILEEVKLTRSYGDLSENAEYHAAKEQQSLNEGRISELEDLVARAEVIDVSKLSGSTIKSPLYFLPRHCQSCLKHLLKQASSCSLWSCTS